MHCRRCGGFMLKDRFYDLLDDCGGLSIDAWRCVNCGEVVDGMIALNRSRAGGEERGVRLFAMLIVALSLSLGACSGIPSGVMKQVDQGLTFEDAKTAPEQHRGKVFLLGGTVEERQDLKDRTWMLIHQHSLDSSNQPHIAAPSEGEFVVVISPPVDPAQYRRGKRVTVVGRMIGLKQVAGSDPARSFPSFVVLYLHPWKHGTRSSEDLPYDPAYLESEMGYAGRMGDDGFEPCYDCYPGPWGQ